LIGEIKRRELAARPRQQKHQTPTSLSRLGDARARAGRAGVGSLWPVGSPVRHGLPQLGYLLRCVFLTSRASGTKERKKAATQTRDGGGGQGSLWDLGGAQAASNSFPTVHSDRSVECVDWWVDEGPEWGSAELEEEWRAASQVRHPRPRLFTAVGVKRRCSHLTGTTSSTPPSPGLAASTASCASSCQTRRGHSRDIAEIRPVHSRDAASRRGSSRQTPLQECGTAPETAR